MTPVASRISVIPLFNFIRLRCLARPAVLGLMLAVLLMLLAGAAQAAGSSMPWEGPLQSILESIQGPVARIVAVIIIIATGLALAFGDTTTALVSCHGRCEAGIANGWGRSIS